MLLNPLHVLFAGRDDQTAALRVRQDLGVRGLSAEAVTDLAAVNLLHQRQKPFCFRDRADFDEPGLLRHRDVRAILQLGDDVDRGLEIPRRAGNDDALAAGLDGDVGRGQFRAPPGIRRLSASVRILPRLAASELRGRKTLVTCTVWERRGAPPSPWTGLSTLLIRFSIVSSWPTIGAATISRFWVASTISRAFVAAAAAVSLGAATPGMACRIICASSSAFVICGK